MKTRKWVGIVVVAVLMTMADRTWGQRGMGDNEGVVRQAIETQRISIEGTVKEIVTGPCENTTGPYTVGTHLLVTTDDEKQYNVHLGPAVLVKDLIEPLKAGQSVSLKAFRTEKMPADHSVAVTLTVDGQTVRLRDESLRPVWAGGQGRFFNRSAVAPARPQWGAGYGRGYGSSMGQGRGYGRGMGRGRAWSGGMGYGMGRSFGVAQSMGRGWGGGMGYGRGRGAGGQGRGLRNARLGMCPWGVGPAYQPYCPWSN
ncbi:MAG: hypothetical protein A2Z25_02130 [Planctomycetes bacterium RBG_16_55_9]|nr:MAG: hypothetical protein A2Z25_02130 [Planctomycetes bacterium RBG_16_55_9]